ncbi:MAG: helix-turn-helix transcriptional regulator [Candidatus Eremiobacteraeota bacterium]|nr:helix-turn-helix transcriptional regulator [Candidatus Eremiobacteraeota bacterium]
MNAKRRTFGQTITDLRRQKGLTQKDLAAKIRRRESKAISAQYLNDIEHDRRKPDSEEFIAAVADALDASRSYLAFVAGRLPPEFSQLALDEERLQRAIQAFCDAASDTSPIGQG